MVYQFYLSKKYIWENLNASLISAKAETKKRRGFIYLVALGLKNYSALTVFLCAEVYLQTCSGDLTNKENNSIQRKFCCSVSVMVVLCQSAVIFSCLLLWWAGLGQKEAGWILGHASIVAFPSNPVCIRPIGKMKKKIKTSSRCVWTKSK